MRPPSILTIPIKLTRHAPEPLHEQIAGQMNAAIRGGLLVPQAQLPSTRSLAALLGVSRGVIIAAYELLFASGSVHSRLGSGTYVTAVPEPEAHSGTGRQTSTTADARTGSPVPGRHTSTGVRTQRAVIDLRPGQPSAEAFPLAAWRAAWRRAGFQRPPARMTPPLGVPRLREAISEHLTRTHGICLTSKEIVVTSGLEHGLRVVLAALGLHGRVVAMEEPAPASLPRAAGGPSALPVDICGALTHRIPPGCRAIVISADAQSPHGRILCTQRREAAAQWARESNGFVLELACDTVVRPELSGLPRLSTLAGDRSILLGSFTELFTAEIQLGYLVVPTYLTIEIGRVIRSTQPSYIAQRAMESLLDDGTVVRQMHRLGRLYASKRRLLASSGLSATGTLNSAVLPVADASTALRELASRQILVSTLAPYHFSGPPPPSALVIGYGHLPDPLLRHALDAVSAVVPNRDGGTATRRHHGH